MASLCPAVARAYLPQIVSRGSRQFQVVGDGLASTLVPLQPHAPELAALSVAGALRRLRLPGIPQAVGVVGGGGGGKTALQRRW